MVQGCINRKKGISMGGGKKATFASYSVPKFQGFDLESLYLRTEDRREA